MKSSKWVPEKTHRGKMGICEPRRKAWDRVPLAASARPTWPTTNLGLPAPTTVERCEPYSRTGVLLWEPQQTEADLPQ